MRIHRPRPGASLRVLFPAGETQHQAKLDRLPAGARIEGKGRNRVRTALDQRLHDCILSQPGARGDVRRDVVDRWLSRAGTRLRHPAGRHGGASRHHSVPRRGVEYYSGVHPFDGTICAGRRLA